MPEPGVLDLLYTLAAAQGNVQQTAALETALENSHRPPDQSITPASSTVAGWYVTALGLRVFPLQPGSKIPYKGSRGFKDATVNADQIAAWWNLAADSNVGVATGGPYDVIDIDGADNGLAFINALRAAGGTWCPDVRGVSQTPRGMHLWVPAVPGAHNGASPLGVDYRADGGYVVAPPSHVDGTLYRWLLMPGGQQ